ncbi:slipin family protein [Streptomyces tropicalis]|uniref:Slipin family protein n=1 Tax=Streptomyces tropicalis TaxID=3034234 RepID=A0ABT6A7B9_9ACTN|nr:slipin family protein [Streptomyces tropicalis]MDF3300537.1 slipin family protein [Streptomyces tropicalis]
MEGTVVGVVLVAVVVLLVLRAGMRVVNQVERGVVFRWGKALPGARQPGITFLIPFADRMRKVNVQVITMPVPTQEGITKDNVSVKVDAVVYFRVTDPLRAAIEVQDYGFAVGQVAQSSLRSIIGKSDLDDLLSDRERLHEGLALMIDSPAAGWGIHIDRVEIKDVQLPESLKRSMSRQAEAERERRARVITADGEFQAAQQLANASRIMADTPEAMQLRLLQTVVEVAAEKNSTLVMPFPVELLRYFDRAAQNLAGPAAAQAPAPAGTEAAVPDASAVAAGSGGGADASWTAAEAPRTGSAPDPRTAPAPRSEPGTVPGQGAGTESGAAGRP